MVYPKISVTVPTTFWRYKFLNRIINCFQEQTYPNLELIILDTDSTPDQSRQIYKNLLSLYCNNSTIQYHYFNSSTSIGIKRNMLAGLSSGEFICHFDDDDYYYPDYISTLYNDLDDHDFIKLSSYTLYKSEKCRQTGPMVGEFKYWDYNKVAAHKKWRNFPFKYGYGFTYFYRKEWIENIPMEDINMKEDSTWLRAAMKQGIKFKYTLETDKPLVIHTIHSTSTSGHWANSNPPWDTSVMLEDYTKHIHS
jgi:glycosyltransferase involved in cell wall biosynthesis